MKITFTGRNSQIGEYFAGDYNYTSYDISDSSTWDPLVESDVVFLILPKTETVLDDAKRFMLSAMNSNIKHIVKIGSLGPWRLIHSQLESFMHEARIPYTSFDIAPLMNNIFTEQYDNGILDNYRGRATAPYLDPVCLATAIEQCLGDEKHFYKNYSATGPIQYTIEQVAQTMKKNGFVVNKIVNAKYEKSHSAMTAYTNDFALMKTLGARYLTEDWTPETSWDLKCHFNIGSRTLDQFIKDDKHIFTQNFAEDKNL